MSSFRWGPKPSVAQQRKNAEKKVAQLRKAGHGLSPVVIEGPKIVSSFWGKSWCGNLEQYSDYTNRLPRGRSYVRHGSVIDLQIAKGEITAQVNGSSLYRIRITIQPLAAKAWTDICRDCATSIDSMIELLQGRLSKAVMDRVCRTSDGLFPSPKEIKLSCSCPDGATMCKHVAAALYGVGARLDSRPELLFQLRGVDQQELIAKAGTAPAVFAGKKAPGSTKVLADDDLASVFGLDMAETPTTAARKTTRNDGVASPSPRKRRAAPKTATDVVAAKQVLAPVSKKSRVGAPIVNAAKAKKRRADTSKKQATNSARRKIHNAISMT